MYVLRVHALERIPEVASRRRRDELSLSVTPLVPREGTGSCTPTIGNTPIPVAEYTRQPQNSSGRATPTMTGAGTTPPDREGGRDGPRNPCLIVEVPRGGEEDSGTLGGGPSAEGRKSPERERFSGDRKRQITILRDYIEALRRDRNRMEARILNEHIHRVIERGIQGSELEDLREETQREYAALLRKELQPTLEYFELINEELMEEIPLAEEDDRNFDYPATYDWKEGDYMWLLFKIQQHFAHREVWTRVYRYLSHTQPLHMENHEQALVGLTESWQELFDKSIQVKRAARRALEATGRDKGAHPERS